MRRDQIRRFTLDRDRVILRAGDPRPEGVVQHILPWRRLHEQSAIASPVNRRSA